MAAKIPNIIHRLDRHIETTGVAFLLAPTANAVLASAGLLQDSTSRPGRPLRELLRAGLIDHAYQEGREWRIPHSGLAGAERAPANEGSGERAPAVVGAECPDADVAGAIQRARENYRPEALRCLLIGEAPPEALDRFFYYADVRQHDHLFLGIVEVMFPAAKEAYLAAGRPSEMKANLLRAFQKEGFYLLDVSDEPLGCSNGTLKGSVGGLIRRVGALANSDTPIVLIKCTTHDVAYRPLCDAGFHKVHEERIPFPGQGWQSQFRERFAVAVEQMGLRLGVVSSSVGR